MIVNNVEVNRLSSDDIQDMFTEAFEKDIASQNSIGSYECTCVRDGKGLRVEVLVVGMAGTPTMKDYMDGKVNNSKTLKAIRGDGKEINFVFVPADTLMINSNDYIVIYNIN